MATKKASPKVSTTRKTAVKRISPAKTSAKKSPAKKAAARKLVATPSAKKSVAKPAAKKSAATKAVPAKAAGRKYSPATSRQVGRELHEMHEGKLMIGRSNQKVTNPKQAIAIGLAEARRAGKKVPPNPNTPKNK